MPGRLGYMNGNGLVPVLLASGQRAMVPRADLEAALADPLAAPVTDAPSPTKGDMVRIPLRGGGSALVPAADAQRALRDPLAASEADTTGISTPQPLLSNEEEAAADELADAFDASMGAANNEDTLARLLSARTQGGQQMAGMEFSPDVMTILENMSPEQLEGLFRAFPQEQRVLDQQMALATQARQPGAQRGTPTGALLGGLSNAIGNVAGARRQQQALEGQQALGQAMQQDAAGRARLLMNALNRRRAGGGGMMESAVGDEELARIFGG